MVVHRIGLVLVGLHFQAVELDLQLVNGSCNVLELGIGTTHLILLLLQFGQ